MPFLFDAHNHLQDAWLKPHLSRVIDDLRNEQVTGAVVNGTCQADWAEVAKLADNHRWIRPSFGLHPWHVGSADAGWRDELRARVEQRQDAAIGEIGLDRWIIDRARADDPRLAGLRRAPMPEQIEAFRWQLGLAAERNLPVTIHCLEAWGPLTAELHAAALPPRGFLLHAYGGSIELARELIPLGAYFSFNGSFLGPRHAAKREVFAQLPLERVLAETDAPAMPLPPEFRHHALPDLADGTTINHPANLAVVYAGLARLRGLPLETLAAALEANVHRLFGGDL